MKSMNSYIIYLYSKYKIKEGGYLYPPYIFLNTIGINDEWNSPDYSARIPGGVERWEWDSLLAGTKVHKI